MRGDVFIEEVFAKCEALKSAQVWLSEPRMRPRAWLNNFDTDDKILAAILLEQFTFYSNPLTRQLLISSFNAIGDGLPKGPSAPPRVQLLQDIPNALFTRVDGESPNPTDSGNFFCRMAREALSIPGELIVSPKEALDHAAGGAAVIFLDDIIGSGDQFIRTWQRVYGRTGPSSFVEAMRCSPFTAVYVTLVATQQGLTNVNREAPSVAVSAAHIVGEKATYRELTSHHAYSGSDLGDRIQGLLEKYAPRLQTKPYIDSVTGYKGGGLMLAFEHSVPDLSLPIFWADGTNGWIPLVRRK